MDDILFCKSFHFRVLSRLKYGTTDNTHGIDCHFLARMRSGRARMVSESGEEISVRAGDLFYLPMHLRYRSYWWPEDGCVEWESYGFRYFPNPTGARYAMQRLNPTPGVTRHLDALVQDLHVTAGSVAHLYAALDELTSCMREAEPDPKKALFAKAERYIHAHPDFRASELARHCGMSESSLYAFFRSYANTTPVQVKNAMLVERAVTLLGSTDLPIEVISDRVGFQSVAYFRRLLRAHTGKTPGAIRRERDGGFE